MIIGYSEDDLSKAVLDSDIEFKEKALQRLPNVLFNCVTQHGKITATKVCFPECLREPTGRSDECDPGRLSFKTVIILTFLSYTDKIKGFMFGSTESPYHKGIHVKIDI